MNQVGGFFELEVAVIIIRLQDIDLAQKSHQRSYQIIVKIEVIMCHVRWRQKKRWSCALFLQLICVIDWNQSIADAVQNESRTFDSVHTAQVIKLLRQQKAQKANFAAGDALD